MFLGAPDFARSEKKHSHRFSIFCVFTQPRSFATGSSQQQVGPCPLCPDSDQILHLAEMTQWANCGHSSNSVGLVRRLTFVVVRISF